MILPPILGERACARNLPPMEPFVCWLAELYTASQTTETLSDTQSAPGVSIRSLHDLERYVAVMPRYSAPSGRRVEASIIGSEMKALV